MANMHVPIGFGRKARVYLLVTPLLQVLVDGVPDKIGARCFFFHMIFQSRLLLLPILHALAMPACSNIISAQAQKRKEKKQIGVFAAWHFRC